MRKIFSYISFLVMIVTIGCATPTATIKKDISIKDYKRIYLISPKEGGDPRNIFPKVASRLEDLGFETKVIKPNESIQGDQGSGFVIDSKGYILTCAHLFKKEKTASVWIKGKRYEAALINSDKEKDLALLKIYKNINLNLQPLSIANSPRYKMGQEVYTMGFPLSDILGNSPRLNKGLISSNVGLKDDPDHLQVSAEIQPGNSGCPLLNENGIVIGVMQSTLRPMNILARSGGSLPQNVNFAVKTNTIQKFIDKCESDITLVSKQSSKIDFDQIAESIVIVRAGLITDEFLKQPKMICKVSYVSFWDFWYRFRVFHIEFYNLETGELLLKAGQYGDNPWSTENTVIDDTFEQIRAKFFPNS